MDDTPAAESKSDAATFNFKRRNSIPSAVVVPTITNGLHHHQQQPSPSLFSFSGTDFELLPLKSPSDSYTSLKDLIPHSPSSIMSPTPSSAAATAAVSATSNGGSGYEISIRNRLVKQAAWAYLQPTTMSSSSSPTSRRVFFSGEFLRPKIAGVGRFVADMVTRVYDWLVDALWLILCR